MKQNHSKDILITMLLLGMLSVTGCMCLRPDPDLVLACSFDTEADIRQTSSGYCNGTIVPGWKGGALLIPPGTAAAEFAIPAGSLAKEGCIEFWGRVDAPRILTTCGSPRFLQLFSRKPQTEISCDWNCNNGSGGSGFTVRLDGVLLATSHDVQGSPSRDQILNGQTAGWHHYAFVWNEDGITDFSAEGRKVIVAVMLDGELLMLRTAAEQPNWKFKTLTQTPSVLYIPDRTDEMPSYGRVPYSIDELKVWKKAKTQFEL